MTKNETDNWFDEFYAHFRGVESYHAKMPEHDLRRTVDAWRDVLFRLDYDHAIQAVKMIAAGDEDEPKHWDYFPATIRRIADKLAKTRYVGQPQRPIYAKEDTRNCRMCYDQGNACQVYSRHAMELAKDREKLEKALRRRRLSLGDREWLDLLDGVEPNKLLVHHPVHVISEVTNVICTCHQGVMRMRAHESLADKRQGYSIPVQFNPQEMFPTFKQPRDPDILRDFYTWCLDTKPVDWVTQEAF